MSIIYTAFDSRHQLLANSKLWIHAVDTSGIIPAIIGAISIEEIPEWFWLNDLLVHTVYRRRGIGARLITEAMRICRQQEGRRIGVCCAIRPENTASTTLFEVCGFNHVCCWTDGESRLYSTMF